MLTLTAKVDEQSIALNSLSLSGCPQGSPPSRSTINSHTAFDSVQVSIVPANIVM
ncbi:hypothetical protein P3T22_006677 [Paraburkholderia sp. GAS348]|jgi:hypothetical protein